MDFNDLVEKTLYKPTTLALAVLYGRGSARVLKAVADSGYILDESERSRIIEYIAPKHKRKKKAKPASPQLDLIDNATAGNEAA